MSLHSLLSARYPIRVADPLASVQRALQRSFDEAYRGLPAGFMTEAAAMPVALDVREDDKAFYVTADLPGLVEGDIDVSFDKGVLTIRGEKKLQRDETKETWHIVERSTGSFARQLSLTAEIDGDKVEAAFDKGVLTVTLPKLAKEQASARKIQIKTS